MLQGVLFSAFYIFVLFELLPQSWITLVIRTTSQNVEKGQEVKKVVKKCVFRSLLGGGGNTLWAPPLGVIFQRVGQRKKECLYVLRSQSLAKPQFCNYATPAAISEHSQRAKKGLIMFLWKLFLILYYFWMNVATRLSPVNPTTLITSVHSALIPMPPP